MKFSINVSAALATQHRNTVQKGRTLLSLFFYAALGITLADPLKVSAQDRFIRGDTNQDGTVDISDVVRSLLGLFAGVTLRCADAADINDDGVLNITDAIYTLEFLLREGAAAPSPGPGEAGYDPTPDELTCLRSGSAVVDENGGGIEGPGRAVLEIPKHTFDVPTFVHVEVLPFDQIPPLPEVSLPFLSAISIEIGGNIESSGEGLQSLPNEPLNLRIPVEQQNGFAILTQSIIYNDTELLHIVASAVIDNSIARTTQALAGIRTTGLYALYSTDSPTSTGTALWSNGDVASGAVVWLNKESNIVSIADTHGLYALASSAAGLLATGKHACTQQVLQIQTRDSLVFDCLMRECPTHVGLRNGNFEDGPCIQAALPQRDAWVTHHHDAERSAKSLVIGPATRQEHIIVSSPDILPGHGRARLEAVGSNGTVYLLTTTPYTVLYALSSDWRVLWSRKVYVGALTIAQDNRLYILGTLGVTVSLLCIDQSNGSSIWEHPLGGTDSRVGDRSLVASQDGNMYLVGGNPSYLRAFKQHTEQPVELGFIVPPDLPHDISEHFSAWAPVLVVPSGLIITIVDSKSREGAYRSHLIGVAPEQFTRMPQSQTLRWSTLVHDSHIVLSITSDSLIFASNYFGVRGINSQTGDNVFNREFIGGMFSATKLDNEHIVAITKRCGILECPDYTLRIVSPTDDIVSYSGPLSPNPTTAIISDSRNNIFVAGDITEIGGTSKRYLSCFSVDNNSFVERWRLLMPDLFGPLVLGPDGTLYSSRSSPDTVKVTATRGCATGSIPGWSSCTGTVLGSFVGVRPKYGNYMAVIPVPAETPGDVPHSILEQVFAGPMPIQARILACDMLIVTDAIQEFVGEFVLQIEASGVQKIGATPVKVREENVIPLTLDEKEWIGVRPPRRTGWIHAAFTEEELQPFKGRVCTLNLIARISEGTTVVLLDGFRFGKVNVYAHKIQGAHPNPDQDIARANKIYQQAGIAFSVVGFDIISSPDDNNDGAVDDYIACAFPTIEEGKMIVYSSPSISDVDVFYVNKFRGGILGNAFCGLFNGKMEMIASKPGSIVLAHEVGHVLGLQHSGVCVLIGCIGGRVVLGDPSNLMYPIAGELSVRMTFEQVKKILSSKFVLPE